MNILIVTTDTAKWQTCLPVFQAAGTDVSFAASLEACKEALRSNPPRLYILDLGLKGKELRAAFMELLMINATDMEENAFHDAMEGLGILTGLPPAPSQDDVRRLLDLLAKV